MKIDFMKDWILTKDDNSSLLIDLPYDAMIKEQRYQKCVNGKESAFFPGKKYTYTKKFNINRDNNKYFAILFEGVYRNATVKLNSKKVAFTKYGFTEFLVDISRDVLDGIYTVAESALTDPVDVANYYIALKEFPVNYFLKGSIPSEAYTTFGDYLRQVSEYNRTDGYAQAVPYRDADPYDGVNPYYYEFDIALPGLPYSTSNRGVGRVVIWQDGFDCTGYDYSPVAVYTDDHYATFQEFLNYGTYGERFNAEKSRTAYIYNAYNTLSPA